jgi:hypothetical protein
MPASRVALVLAAGLAGALPSTADAARPQRTPDERARDRAAVREAEARRPRRFLVGLEGVGFQVPALDPQAARFDPRYVGRTVALGGAGLLARALVAPFVALEFGARSGSVRYRSESRADVVSHDLVTFELGTVLWLVRGDVARLGIDGGVGGVFQRVAYEIGEDPRSTQRFGSLLARAGADAEFVLRRVAVVLSLRSYGIVTGRERTHVSGPAFEGDASAAAPVSTYQTYLAASAGLAYRF